MTMAVMGLQVPVGEVNYYSEAFRNLLENHLQILSSSSSYRLAEVRAIDSYKYSGDLYGLLNQLNVPSEYHWITLRLNGLHSPMDYKGDLLNIKIPNIKQLETYLSRWLNQAGYV